MKKSYEKNKNHAASLREALAPLDERCPTPGALAAGRLLQHAAPSRGSYAVPPRRGLALAMTLAVVLSSALLSDRLNLFSGGRNKLAELEPMASMENSNTEITGFGTSYYELEQAFLSMQKEQKEIYAAEKRAAGGFRAVFDGAMMATMPAADADLGGSIDYALGKSGETNTQVQGVDEADVLKTDGGHLYYIQGGRLYIVQALPELNVLSSMAIPNYRQNAELYLLGNRMALVYSEYPPGGDPAASVQVYDIADKTRPLLVKSFSQPGSLLSSRLMNGRIYLISTQWANLDFRVKDGVIPPEDILPQVYDDGQARTLPVRCIALLPERDEPSYLMASSVDIESSRPESESAAILGAGSQMYCSRTALFVACQQYQSAAALGGRMRAWGIGNKTVIYKFDLLPGGEIKSAGAGEAPGAPLNQFSMDEYKGYFRIATTGNREKDGETVNFITILDGNLKQAGNLENIAPGERIQSARFIGGKGYIVTFRQTDPLFVIDLENPAAPKILGELKLPGFSAYLHPWDATHLIGIGPGGDEQGTDSSTKVSLFDISDPARPREVDRAIIPNAWSEIQQNHKILSVCREKGLFGLPLRGYGQGAGFYTFHVRGDRISSGWTLKAAAASQAENAALDADLRYGYYPKDSLRGTYIGNTWYVLGAEGVAAYAMDSGREAGSVMFQS